MENEEVSKQEKKIFIEQEIVDWLESMLIAVTIALFIVFYLVKISSVVGGSMEPTLHQNDKILVVPLFYSLEVGDIVVCEKDLNRGTELIVKRVIAVEGQTVDIDTDNKKVIVDGVMIDEPYTDSDTYFGVLQEPMEFPLTVGKDEYFVLGDHREVSLDSRYKEVGLVTEEELFGEVVFRIYPFDKIGKLN